MRRTHIGIWGPSGSGKTSYLSALLHEARKPEFLYRVRGVDHASMIYLVKAPEFLNNGNFPPPTEFGIEPRPYVFEFERKRDYTRDDYIKHRRKAYELNFVDAAGRLIGEYQTEVGSTYLQLLQNSRGILLMLDPDLDSSDEAFGSETGSYDASLAMLFHNLPKLGLGSKKIRTFMAFCITKCDLDHNWEKVKPYWDKRMLPSSMLSQFLNTETFELVNTYCDPTRFAVFATSVAGRLITDNGDNRPNILSLGNRFELIETQNRRSHHVVEPLLWLFKQIDKETLYLWDKPGRQDDFDSMPDKD